MIPTSSIIARPILVARPGYQTAVINRFPKNMGDERNNSQGGLAHTANILDRPGWQGKYEGASIDRAPGNTNDTLIERTRSYMYRRPYYISPATASGNLNWTAAGPARDMPTTRFNRNWRPLVGGSHQNMWGWHTNPSGARDNKLAGKSRMRPGKQNNLTVQRYRGQSYSQTTVLAGQ